MRIIAGTAGGRRLKGPSGSGTRPMMDRAKEAVFSSLGGSVIDAAVLDLFAGTGSLGLEALSRGAESALFVERSRAALSALSANIAAVGLGGEIVSVDVEAFLDGAMGEFDLVFVDPPYALSLASVETILSALVDVLAEGALVVLHRRAGSGSPEPPPCLVEDSRRRYGDAEITRWVKEDA